MGPVLLPDASVQLCSQRTTSGKPCHIADLFSVSSFSWWQVGWFLRLIPVWLLSECSQRCWEEFDKYLYVVSAFYCRTSYHRLDHTILIIEYNRKIKVIPKHSLRLEPSGFQAYGHIFLWSPYRNKQFCSLWRSCIVLTSWIKETVFIGNRTEDIFSGLCNFICNILFEADDFDSWRRSSVLLAFRATGNALTGNRTRDPFFRDFFRPLLSSWSEGISIHPTNRRLLRKT